jgi:hypothetical protein
MSLPFKALPTVSHKPLTSVPGLHVNVPVFEVNALPLAGLTICALQSKAEYVLTLLCHCPLISHQRVT